MPTPYSLYFWSDTMEKRNYWKLSMPPSNMKTVQVKGQHPEWNKVSATNAIGVVFSVISSIQEKKQLFLIDLLVVMNYERRWKLVYRCVGTYGRSADLLLWAGLLLTGRSLIPLSGWVSWSAFFLIRRTGATDRSSSELDSSRTTLERENSNPDEYSILILYNW